MTVQWLDENALWIFLLVSVVLGGGAAALAGRAIARTWRPIWQVVAYGFILGAAVRFIYFSVFNGTLLSAHFYLVDTAVCIAFGFLGFRACRASQMVTQYHWLIEPAGALRWRRRKP